MSLRPRNPGATAAVARDRSAGLLPRINAALPALPRIETLGLLVFYALLAGTFALASDRFLTLGNAGTILSNVTLLGIVAIGQALAVISGKFDLSVSGTVALSSILYAVISNAGVPIPVAMLLATSSGAAVGLVNGLVVSRMGINPLITTLATLSITLGLANSVTKGLTTPLTDERAGFLAELTVGGISYASYSLIVLLLITHFVLTRTVFGRALYAQGGNPMAATLAGIRVTLNTTLIYVLCGLLSGYAGVVVTSQLLAGSATAGGEVSLTSVSAVFLGGAALGGGVGGMPGTMLGVLIIGTISNGLAILLVPAFYQQIATGVVLLTAVAFARMRSQAGPRGH